MSLLDASYGADEHGLVWAYRFADGAAGQPADRAQVAASLGAGDAPATFLWLHFSLSHAGSERWMREHLSLPEAFYESLHAELGSTRLELDDDALIASIHDVLFDAALEGSDVGTTTLCVDRRILVSARLRPLRSIEQLRAAVRAGKAFRSPIELLAHLLQDQASVLADILRKATVRVDEIEDRLLARRIQTDRQALGTLRRTLVRLQRLLAPEPSTLFRLLNRPPAWIGRDDVQDLQQAAEEFSTAIGDSAALVERVKLIQEEHAAVVNERTARTLFVLTVVTVLALPINLVAGLFGMNVGGVPLASAGHGFATVVGVLVGLTALLAYFAFGRNRD